jgi:hypothetical protein
MLTVQPSDCQKSLFLMKAEAAIPTLAKYEHGSQPTFAWPIFFTGKNSISQPRANHL